MKIARKMLLILGILVVCAVSSSQAQIVVNVRPVMPHYVRVEAPSPRHVWIGEEWEPRGGTYVFVGGHWAMPPYPRAVWIGGHWDRRPRGEVWVPGHWRRR